MGRNFVRNCNGPGTSTCEKKLSELAQNAVSQSVTIQNIILTVSHKLIGSGELMVPPARFLATGVEVEADKEENIYKLKDEVMAVSSSR